MRARLYALLMTALALLVAAPAGAQTDEGRKQVRVGLVLDGPSERFEPLLKLMEAEIELASQRQDARPVGRSDRDPELRHA